MQRFGLSDVQAQAILDMQLKRLQGLEKEKLQAEYDELEKKIAYYQEILADENKVKAVLKDELLEIREKYGDDRLTEIQDVEDEIDIEDLIEEEACCYTLSSLGYIKRLPTSTYRAQKRGGRGVTAQTLKEEDYVKRLFVASTHDYLLFFSNTGKVHRRKGYRIPEAGRTARGTAIVNVLPLEPGETITAMLHTRDMEEGYLMMVTRMGTVKRLELSSLNTNRKAGIRAISLDEGDELIAVFRTTGSDRVVLATEQGMSILFAEEDVRPMGRDAAGVRGIRLDEGDRVIGAVVVEEGKDLLTVTRNGFGKRTPFAAYLRDGEPQSRGGKGLKNNTINEKTGRVAGILAVSDSDDVMLIESSGVIIRMAASEINTYGRGAQGVILMRVEEGERVIALQSAEQEDGEE